MANIRCPACSSPVPEAAKTCPNCGKAIEPPPRDTLPVRRAGGKLQIIGTVILAGAIIATVTGAWWGPAMLFPGVVALFLGKIW